MVRSVFIFATAVLLLHMGQTYASESASEVPGGTAADTNGVVVGQGAATLSLAEIDAFAQRFPDDKRGQIFDSPERVQTILLNMLATQQLAKEARARGLDAKPIVQERMRQAAQEVLAKTRMQDVRSNLVAEIPDMEQLAHEKYLANPEEYVQPERVAVRHILIGTEQRSDKDAKALADKLRKELESEPSRFKQLVEKYSDDESKRANEGLIVDATSSHFVPEFRGAAGALNTVGEISPVVKTSYGYHILKLIKFEPQHQQSFAEVKPRLTEELESQYIGKKLQLYKDEIRNRPLHDVDPELVASLRTRYYPNHERPTVPAPATSAAAPATATTVAAPEPAN